MIDTPATPKRCDAVCAKGFRCKKDAGHTVAGDLQHYSDDGCVFYDKRPVRIADEALAKTFRYCEHCGGAIPAFASRCPCHPANKDQPAP